MASIRKRGKSYQVTVSNGRDIHDRQILETATWKPDPNKTKKQNQRALERFAMDFEDRVKSGKYLDGEKVTFQEFAGRWMEEYARIRLEPTTTEIYGLLLDAHIIPAIGHLRLSRVQPQHLNRLYSEMLTQRRDGKAGGYSPATVKRVHAIISSIMSTAVQWGIVTENPCRRIRPPRQEKGEASFFTPEQAAMFLDELDRETREGTIPLQHNIFFQMALFCGLRRGEIVALQWQDIDFGGGTVTVNKSTAIVGGKRHQKAPKNRTSERVVSVPAHVLGMLRSYRKEYDAYQAQVGSQWAGSGHIFIQWDGSQMYPSTPVNAMRKIIARYNSDHEEKLPHVTPHGLRHTSATLLISQNVDIRTVSNRLGHAQTSTTMNIYTHALQKKDEQAAEALEALLAPSRSLPNI